MDQNKNFSSEPGKTSGNNPSTTGSTRPHKRHYWVFTHPCLVRVLAPGEPAAADSMGTWRKRQVPRNAPVIPLRLLTIRPGRS